MQVTCPNCHKVVGETKGRNYIANRGGFRLDGEGNVWQMCRHCGEEFKLGVSKGGFTIKGKNAEKVVE
jgi:hypothetical protein